MTILYHPGFAGDIRRYASKCAEISPKLERRFRRDIDAAIMAVKGNPTSADNFIGSSLFPAGRSDRAEVETRVELTTNGIHQRMNPWTCGCD